MGRGLGRGVGRRDPLIRPPVRWRGSAPESITNPTRELDATLLARATTVVVEDIAAALPQAGDVILAIAKGTPVGS
jgi:hypothetical protein